MVGLYGWKSVQLSPESEFIPGSGADDDPSPEDVDDVVATITIDGKEYTEDELKSNMMFQSDYTRKTKELADDRRKFDEERARLNKPDKDDDTDKDKGKPDKLADKVTDLEFEIRMDKELSAIERDNTDVMSMRKGDVFTEFEEEIKAISQEEGLMPKAAFDVFIARNLDRIKSTADKKAADAAKKGGADAQRRRDADTDHSSRRGGDPPKDEFKIIPGESLNSSFKRAQELRR